MTARLLRRFFERSEPQSSAHVLARSLVAQYLVEAHETIKRDPIVEPKRLQAGSRILEASADVQVNIVVDTTRRLVTSFNDLASARKTAELLQPLLSSLIGKSLPFGEQQLSQLAQDLATAKQATWWLPLRSYQRIIDQFVNEHGLSPHLRTSLRALQDAFTRHSEHAEARGFVHALHAILESGGLRQHALKLGSGEAWTEALGIAQK